MSKINLIELERTININFINKENLILSLTHKSHNSKINNERLEFIGDRVLGLIISSELLKIYPNQKVGYLDKMFASMVNKRTLLNIGKKIGLEKFIIGGSTSKKNIEPITTRIIWAPKTWAQRGPNPTVPLRFLLICFKTIFSTKRGKKRPEYNTRPGT